MKRTMRNILKMLAAVAIAYAMINAVLADRITLRDAAESPDAAVTLGEVAILEGERAQALADVEVAAFAQTQPTLTVTMREIRRILTERKVHWGKVTCRGARRITVRRDGAAVRHDTAEDLPQTTAPNRGDAAAVIDAEPRTALANPVASLDDGRSPIVRGTTLRDRLIQWLGQAIGASDEDLKITCRNPDDPNWQLSELDGRFEFEPVTGELIGRVAFVVRQYGHDRRVNTVRLTVDVERRITIVTAAADLRRGQTVAPGDVRVQQIWQTGARRQPVSDPTQVIGQSVSRNIRAGDGIARNDVRSPIVVRRGQLVTVRCVSGSLVLRSVLRAMEEGAVGDLVKVKNEKTRQTLGARVTGPQEAVIILRDGPPASGQARGGPQ